MYYLQSRYYDPEVGRFLNADTFVSTGQGFIGSNMFTYCNNNPVCYSDSRGTRAIDAIFKVTHSPADNGLQDIWEIEHAAREIAEKHTEIDKATVEKDSNYYTTYYAAVESDLFAKWKDDRATLKRAVSAYAYYLHNRISAQIELDNSYPYWIMSQNHIYSEMMAHLDVWFLLGEESTRIANLNVDETRLHVVAIMVYHGYGGKEEYVYD